jgi:hypothetical protein
MANGENKGGFFSRFKKSAAPAREESGIKSSTTPPVQAQNRTIETNAENSGSLASSVQPKIPVTPKPVAASESSVAVVDTLEAFSRYCASLADIGTSQLKIVEMTLGMLSNSLNKIVDDSKIKK